MTDQPTTHSRESLPDLDKVMERDLSPVLPDVNSLWATVVVGRSPVTKIHTSEGLARAAYKSATRKTSGYPTVLLQRLDVPEESTAPPRWRTVQEFKRGLQESTVSDFLTETYGLVRYVDDHNTAWLYKGRLVVLHTNSVRRNRSGGKVRVFLNGTTTIGASTPNKFYSRYGSKPALVELFERHEASIKRAIAQIDAAQ